MNLDYCEEDFTREEVYALFEAFIKKNPEHHIKRIDGYPYYLGREIGAWCADVHNKALAGVLILGKTKKYICNGSTQPVEKFSRHNS